MKTIHVSYEPRDRVKITLGGGEIIGYVVEVAMTHKRTVYRVAWMHNGALNLEYFDDFLLESA